MVPCGSRLGNSERHGDAEKGLAGRGREEGGGGVVSGDGGGAERCREEGSRGEINEPVSS